MTISKSIIFWDWNGTLLNDTTACVKAMNSMLNSRQRKGIGEEYYKSVFGFPVINYYKGLGFNFDHESFEDLSVEFISNYNNNLHTASLQPFTTEVLSHFKNSGKKQVVISAMEQKMLLKQIEAFGLTGFFDDIRGIENIYAKSKAHLAHTYIRDNKVNSKDILFIGDTLHDKEVADEIGADSVLVAAGHQNKTRLQINGNRVINNLEALLHFT